MNLKLRALRESHDLTVGQMVERLGIQDSRYRKWESQAAAIPLEYACACCDILHCTLDELAGRTIPSITPDEMTLVDGYRYADDGQRFVMLATAKAVIDKANADADEKKKAV